MDQLCPKVVQILTLVFCWRLAIDVIKISDDTESSFTIRSQLNEVCNHLKKGGRGCA